MQLVGLDFASAGNPGLNVSGATHGQVQLHRMQLRCVRPCHFIIFRHALFIII
ncbi:hypothetical protein D3C71_642570 [compost metagenome]